ncbi:MAG: hypothetical protein ACOC5E_03425 [Acidobacteriota bacterium]
MRQGSPTTMAMAPALVLAVAALGCDSTPLETDRSPPPDAAARSAGATVETADVVGQGPDGPVVAEEGATIRRTPKGINVRLSMPTPEPGSYTYPSGPEGGAWTDEEGPPEAFTLWVFVFDDPTVDDPDELAFTGAFLGAGHVVGGPELTLSGRVSTNTEPFVGEALDNPREARVHLAVAPHGALDPELMPDQIQTPTEPGPDIWWLAVFE